MHDFILALIGGAMIGLAAVSLMATQGKIMGVSGMLSELPSGIAEGDYWRLSFIIGILSAPIVTLLVTGYSPPIDITENISMLVAGGLLVGAGTVLGNGCTSGHGVCGLSRLSVRSRFATFIFMLTASITVWVVKVVGGL